MTGWLNRWFRLEEINGHEACPTYLYRWTLLRRPSWAVYLHHFVADDWSIELHDHPKRFWSIGLKGSYVEQTNVRDRATAKHYERFRAPWFRSFPATHRHRISLPRRRDGSCVDCWTLVVVGPKEREWGFYHGEMFIHWHVYVNDADLVQRVKTCH